MSDFTQLELNTPIIIPPKEEIVYNKGWIDSMTITSPCVNKVQIYAKIIPCRDNPETGDKELKNPLQEGDTKVVIVDNVWEILPTNPKFAMAMELIFQSILEYGRQVGVFFDPSTLVTETSGLSGDTLTTDVSGISGNEEFNIPDDGNTLTTETSGLSGDTLTTEVSGVSGEGEII